MTLLEINFAIDNAQAEDIQGIVQPVKNRIKIGKLVTCWVRLPKIGIPFHDKEFFG